MLDDFAFATATAESWPYADAARAHVATLDARVAEFAALPATGPALNPFFVGGKITCVSCHQTADLPPVAQ